eukprot:COSAG06_NODE_65959_length_255_cov_1.301282_1_plen_47_part_10
MLPLLLTAAACNMCEQWIGTNFSLSHKQINQLQLLSSCKWTGAAWGG